jgi:hypothetical protein
MTAQGSERLGNAMEVLALEHQTLPSEILAIRAAIPE